MTTVGSMYGVKPFYSFQENMELPDIMYKMPNILCGKTNEFQVSEEKVSKDLVLLELQQSRLIAKLDNFIDDISSNKTVAKAVNSERLFQAGNLTDIVIHAKPDDLPLFLKFIRPALQARCKVLWKVHCHSSLHKVPNLDRFWCNEECTDRSLNQIVITIIFKEINGGPIAYLSPTMNLPICGESNIARLFGRILGIYDTGSMDDLTTLTDVLLDASDVISSQFSSNSEKSTALMVLCKALEKSTWLCGSEPSLADAVALSSVYKSGLVLKSPKLKMWMEMGHKRF